MHIDDIEKLKSELIALECALHKLENRSDPEFMESILHPEFLEFGRSGRIYRRQEIIEEFQSVRKLPEINTSEFAGYFLAKDVFLLTYLSSHSGDNAQPCRKTLRTSVWIITRTGPQLRFHQGTAIEE